MLGSTVLDIAIGLIVTYLALSLVVTASNELLATFMRSRARDLERGIRNLIDGKSDVPERWWQGALRWLPGIPNLLGIPLKKAQPHGWSESFFDHPLINSFSKDKEMPCYIPSQTFAAVVLNLVQRSASPVIDAESQAKAATEKLKSADTALADANSVVARLAVAVPTNEVTTTAGAATIDKTTQAVPAAAGGKPAETVVTANAATADRESTEATSEHDDGGGMSASAIAAEAPAGTPTTTDAIVAANVTALAAAQATANDVKRAAEVAAAEANKAKQLLTAAVTIPDHAAPPVSNGQLANLVNLNDVRAAIAKINNPNVKGVLLALVEEAARDSTYGVTELKKFTSQIEIWYDHAMDRVTGWYIRRTRGFLFAIAAAFAIILNVDSVAICRQLGSNSTLRDSLVESAKQYTAQTAVKPPTDSSTEPPGLAPVLQKVQTEIGHLTGLGIPLGWKCLAPPSESEISDAKTALAAAKVEMKNAMVTLAEAEAAAQTAPGDLPKQKAAATAKIHRDQAQVEVTNLEKSLRELEARTLPRDDDLHSLIHGGVPFIFTKLAGLLLTILAASLGAPFWFDILNKFMSVRGAGKAPEEKPKEPKVVLQPHEPGAK